MKDKVYYEGIRLDESKIIDAWVNALNNVKGGDWYFCKEDGLFKDYMTDRVENLFGGYHV